MLANVNEQPVVVALVVPILMSVLMAVAGWQTKPKVRELRAGIRELGRALNVTVQTHVDILDWPVSWSAQLK